MNGFAISLEAGHEVQTGFSRFIGKFKNWKPS